jgi:hypothetical protein
VEAEAVGSETPDWRSVDVTVTAGLFQVANDDRPFIFINLERHR